MGVLESHCGLCACIVYVSAVHSMGDVRVPGCMYKVCPCKSDFAYDVYTWRCCGMNMCVLSGMRVQTKIHW